MQHKSVLLAYLLATETLVKPKQWRLNDPIKSGQDKAIRVSLMAVEMEWRLAGVYIVVYMYQETRSQGKPNSQTCVIPGDAFSRLCSIPSAG